MLLAGGPNRASTSVFDTRVRHGQHKHKLGANSYATQRVMHCSYGPGDDSTAMSESLMTAPAQHEAANRRISKTERGKSCKRGCLMRFAVSQLAGPEVTRIVGWHFTVCQRCRRKLSWCRRRWCKLEISAHPASVTSQQRLGQNTDQCWHHFSGDFIMMFLLCCALLQCCSQMAVHS